MMNKSLTNKELKTTIKHPKTLGWLASIVTFWGFALLILFGHIRDILSKLLKFKKVDKEYAPLLSGFESFYIRRLYNRIQDSWNNPIQSSPTTQIEIIKRDKNSEFNLLNATEKCINLGSYNYLGFAKSNNYSTKLKTLKTLDEYSVANCSSRNNVGTTKLHLKLEKMIAKHTNKQKAVIFSMGFGVNSTVIPILSKNGDLILSDSNNHTSIVTGCNASNANVMIFPHNDTKILEKMIIDAIIQGHPITHYPWNRIIIIVEGLYSMEGHYCPLKEIVRIKKQYKCYLYIDEAHSFGALGKNGKGVCEMLDVNSNDVDIIMGTFTKSFSGFGGFIASSKNVIDYIVHNCGGYIYAQPISAVITQQIISALEIIMNDKSNKIIKKLHENANFFREGLIKIGCHVIGCTNSPVIIIILGAPAKIAAFFRECLSRKLATVVVGFPATEITGGRVRFCISSEHTKKELKYALNKISEVCNIVHCRYNTTIFG